MQKRLCPAEEKTIVDMFNSKEMAFTFLCLPAASRGCPWSCTFFVTGLQLLFLSVGSFPVKSSQPLCFPTELATSLCAALEGHPPPLNARSWLLLLSILDNVGHVCIHGRLHGYCFLGTVTCKLNA